MADYSIWVAEYAYGEAFPVAALVYSAHDQGNCYIPFSYVVIKGRNGVNALVDVGYDDKGSGGEMGRAFGVVNWHGPRDVLAECGLTPEDITHVFITHAHFDHMGNTDAFPNATFYVQERELAKWVWAMSLDQRFRTLLNALDTADILRAVELARQRRLVCVDGALEDVVPGISLHPAYDTHTWGSMYVSVRNDGRAESEDTWVLAGDLVYRFENLTGYEPGNPCYLPVGNGVGSNANGIMALHEMTQRVGGDLARIIPVHEGRLAERYPSRKTDKGLQLVEIVLADGEPSRVTAS